MATEDEVLERPILVEPDESVQDTEPEGPTKKASVFGAFFNITNCAVGAGILSLPYAFETMGLLQTKLPIQNPMKPPSKQHLELSR